MSDAAVADAPAAVDTAAVTETAAAPATGFLGTQTATTAETPGKAGGYLFGDGVQKDGAFVEGWTSSLAEKHPSLANQMMRYKTEADAVAGLDNLVKLVGKKTAGVSYPKEGATPEEISAFRAEAGVPGRAEEYNLKPEKLPEGVEWDDATGKTFAELMHKHHVPAAAAKALAATHVEVLAQQRAAESAAQSAKLAEFNTKSSEEFRKEWGSDFEHRLNANNDFIGARLTEADMKDPALALALSHPAIVRMIDEARRASREAPLPGAGATAALGSMSPRQQAMDIMRTNPNWQKDADLARRVNDLYAQEAQADKRKSR